MYFALNQKMRVILLIFGLLMVLLVALYHADLGFIDQDYLGTVFVVPALVAFGIIILGIPVSLSKDIIGLVLFPSEERTEEKKAMRPAIPVRFPHRGWITYWMNWR